MADRALITGVTGQDGSYLADLLLSEGCEVWGLTRQSSSGRNVRNLGHCLSHGRFHLISGDLTDPTSIERALRESEPEEIYNLAAQSFVGESWNVARYTFEVNTIGFMTLVELACRRDPAVRIYQASSSEMYGNVYEGDRRITEESPMRPRSPYGASKLAAHRMARVYRESFGWFVACGIGHNHESERRGQMFVTRKIARGIAEIAAGQRERVRLGNLDAKRDWGYAPDYVRAMASILGLRDPDDFVIATGEARSVKEFVEAAQQAAGLWGSWKQYVQTDPSLLRPAEVHTLVGDASKLRAATGWEPSVTFEQLVGIMVRAEMERLELAGGAMS